MAFCKQQFPDIPERGHAVSIARAVRYAHKAENILVECPYVDIYTDEFEYIDSLPISDNAKKVMFTIMVHKKLDKMCYEARNDDVYQIFTYAINRRYSTLKRVAKLSKVKDVGEVMHELYCNNLVDVIESRGTPFKLNFADKIHFEGKIAIRVTNYESIGMYWEWLTGKPNIGVCCECWQVYSARSKRRCFCEQHQGYQKLGIQCKRVVCQDCGEMFEVSVKNTKSVRCQRCQTAHKLVYDANRVHKLRRDGK